MQTSVILSLSDSTSAIPYPAVDRGDSSHEGFVPLRGNVDALSAIEGAIESAALKQALERINGSSTPFFTVACRKVLNQADGRFWTRGYLEFALNYLEVAKDSPNYYLLYEQFARHVNSAGFDVPVDFNFELRRAVFSSVAEEGHTACVWITTAEFPSEEGAEKAWNQSVAFLSEFLGSFEKLDLPVIYEERREAPEVATPETDAGQTGKRRRSNCRKTSA